MYGMFQFNWIRIRIVHKFFAPTATKMLCFGVGQKIILNEWGSCPCCGGAPQLIKVGCFSEHPHGRINDRWVYIPFGYILIKTCRAEEHPNKICTTTKVPRRYIHIKTFGVMKRQTKLIHDRGIPFTDIGIERFDGSGIFAPSSLFSACFDTRCHRFPWIS
jgi:hypothetical protein